MRVIFPRAVLNALTCVGIAALGEVIMYGKATSKLLSKTNHASRVMQLPVVTENQTRFFFLQKFVKTVIHATVFNDERCKFHVILTLFNSFPASFPGEETSVFKCSVSKETECSRVGKQSFIITLGCNSVLLQFSSPAGKH